MKKSRKRTLSRLWAVFVIPFRVLGFLIRLVWKTLWSPWDTFWEIVLPYEWEWKHNDDYIGLGCKLLEIVHRPIDGLRGAIEEVWHHWDED